jgi:hypothetical protein
LYIKSHLRFILQELIQSSLDCSYQQHDEKNILKLSFIIACGKEDISFRIQEEMSFPSAPYPALRKSGAKSLKSKPCPPKISLAKLMAKYWGGDIETVQSGTSFSSYMHLSVESVERIPPILDTMPTDLLGLILGNSFQERQLVPSKAFISAEK